MHQTMKTKPFNKRNPKTAPNRSHSYQKGHLCIPKTQATPDKNPQTRGSRPPPAPTDPLLHPPHRLPKTPRQPRPPHHPPLSTQPPRHRHQQLHVARDPIHTPPHPHEDHPRPIILHPRLQPQPQPLPIPISKQITPQTHTHPKPKTPKK